MRAPKAEYLLQLLDELDDVIGVLRPNGVPIFANRAAKEALSAHGRTLEGPVCAPVQDVVKAVLQDRMDRREVVIEPSAAGPRWRGHVRRFGDGQVLLMLHREAQRPTTTARVAAVLNLEASEARLAVAVAQGRTNAEIARTLGV